MAFQAWSSYFHIFIFDIVKRQLRRAWGLAYDPDTREAMGIWAVLLATEFAKQMDLKSGLSRVREFLEFYRRQGEKRSLAFTCACLGELVQEESKDEARELLKEALDIYRSLGDMAEEASTLRLLGNLAVQEHAYTEAASYLEGSVSAARAAGDVRWLNNSMWDLGQAYLYQGAFEKAFQTFDQLRQDAHAAGWTSYEIFALSTYSFEAVRYGDLNEAREKRRQCMELCQVTQETSGIAWGHYEMGEIDRVEGDLESARHWYEEARKLFEKGSVWLGLCSYQHGLGDLALAHQDFASALEHFQYSLDLAEQERHRWSATYALIGLGRAATGLGDFEAAGSHLRIGLSQAWEQGNTGLALISIGGFASLRAAQGDLEGAVELSSSVESHPVTWRETRSQVTALLAGASAQLPEVIASAAQARGRALDLPTLASTLLAS